MVIALYALHVMTAAYAVRIQAADFLTPRPTGGQRFVAFLISSVLVAVSVAALLGARSA